MSLYKGYKCAACGIVFEENDDVVVCPECGAPHHRGCYFEKGECFLKDKHSEDFKFSPEKIEEPVKEVEKPFEEINTQKNTPEQGFPRVPNEVLFYGGVNPEDTIRRVPVKQLAEYVGPSSGSFLRKWKMIEKGIGGSFNLPAFIFGPVYFLYRKMWLLGIIYLIFSLVSATPSVIFFLANETGKIGDISFWSSVSSIFSYIALAVKALGSFFFNNLYLSKAKEDINNGITKGGVTFLAVPIFLGAVVTVSVILTYIIEILP